MDAPYTGFMHALVRARIPYVPVHVDEIEHQDGKLATLILPNLGALSNAQCAAIRRFVQKGGSLFATGDTSLYNEFGDGRPDFELADLFRAHRMSPAPKLRGMREQRQGLQQRTAADRFLPDAHTYLRLTPELRAQVNGPHAGDEPKATGKRHPVLRGFDETDILAYGGTLVPLRVDSGAVVPLTFIPPFPTYPPETSWMRVPKTDVPGLVLSEQDKSRVAYLPADVDRRYAKEHLPDHGDLLANIVRWVSGGSIPLSVEGPGLIDCHLYEQPGRLILHLVNLTSAGTWRAPVEELIPVGPIKVKIALPHGAIGKTARLLVAGGTRPLSMSQGLVSLEIASIRDHEVVVLGYSGTVQLDELCAPRSRARNIQGALSLLWETSARYGESDSFGC